MRTGIAGFQPGRLRQARQVVGMTKTALAKKVNRSVGTVSKWESGDQKPEVDALLSLTEIFKLPSHWFTKPLPEDNGATHFFRSRVSATKAAREIAKIRLSWLQEMSQIFQKWMNWPEVKLLELSERNVFQISDQQIEQLAEDCRCHWGLGEGPISSVIQAMESAGIVCARDYIGHVKMDGVSTWFESEERPYVFVVADKANGIRNRFDAAHELGHILMHRLVSKEDFEVHHDLIEYHANRFAGAFLMPARSFSRDVRRVTLDNLLGLKPRWKVSVAAMITRCKQLGLIDDSHALRLYKGLSARGWRKGEPLDDSFAPERPKLLSRAAQMIVDHGLHDKASLLDELHLDADNAERLANLISGYFLDSGNFENVEMVSFKPKYGGVQSRQGKVVKFPSR